MNQLRFLSFNFAVCVTNFHFFFKIWVSTSGRSFSALRRLMTYLSNTMKQDQLNSCMLVHSHKTLTDTIDPVAIVKTFASANEQRKGYFGKFK